MDKKRGELLEAARQMEKNMSELYFLYKDSFKEDRDFWQKMAKEESEHMALVELAKDFFDKFPKDIIYNNLDELKKVNNNTKDTIEKYRKTLPSKEEAYKYAFQLENTAYELHYQKLVTDKADSEEMKIFQKLNKYDKDHAERIKRLLTGKT